MHMNRTNIRISILLVMVGCLAFANSVTVGQEQQQQGKDTTNPVFRVPNNQQVPPQDGAQDVPKVAALPDTDALPEKKGQVVDPSTVGVAPVATPHPLDRAIQMAHSGLDSIQKEIYDYSAIMVKRERVDNTLGDPQYARVKIRNARRVNNQEIPLSIYMKFLKPKDVAGREVIWVKGQNDGKLIAHEAGILGVKRFHLDPDGWVAMKGQRYPIYEAGIENLVVKLIEKAERDRGLGMCEVNYVDGAKINGRDCTLIEVIHPLRKGELEFHKAKVYIDKEYNIPIRYAAYDWPTTEGAKPQLIEEYTYIKVQLNVGLQNEDFSPDNPAYQYPSH